MITIQEIHCPNCGSLAERHYIHAHKLVQTQCPTCDYFIVTAADTSKVIEAYAPGIPDRLELKTSR
ncbi:MAG: replication restart DNA helicase PriA [Leptolyngbyaceae cyanobacterium CRU_2_3]|nr:replication restart DNA helicase PriA [Leptolyngbyaceae cyanobacterium CRU_2_3]